jgi:Fe-Mn family superoxide dismutase
MEVHYTKHHQAYVDKLNAALEKYPDLQKMSVDDLLKNIETLKVDNKDRIAIQNNGGGVWNHTFFWNIMGPKKEIDQKLSGEITRVFGSLDEFKKKFTDTATTRFGSGWAWLARDADNKLQLYSTANQDSPLSQGHTPLITLDVWEHAYYIQYKWERAKYIENWWNVLKLI